jgi:hypothetical protein
MRCTSVRCTFMRYTPHEMHAGEVHAHETLTNGGAVVDLSRSELQKTSFCASCTVVPMTRRTWQTSLQRSQRRARMFSYGGPEGQSAKGCGYTSHPLDNRRTPPLIIVATPL